MNSLLERINKWWGSLSSSQKVLYIAIGAGLLTLIIFFFGMLGRVNYAPLYANLDQRDAAAIVEELETQNIPYQLSDGGTTILVPKDRVYNIRLDLASQNLVPLGGMGYELFDQNQLGMSDFQRHINYIRALQGELERTIKQFEEVDQARVHLVIPEPSVFVGDNYQTESSASVALKLKPAAMLAPEQVRAIVLLVANSVEGLKPQNVAVVDMAGNLLSEGLIFDNENASFSASALRQQELKRAFEKDLEERLQSMLEKIVGRGRAIAMVSAVLDFNQQQQTVIEFGEPVIVSQQQTTENQTGVTYPGAVGDENLDLQPPAGIEGGGSTYNREDIITNYEIPKSETVTIVAPGGLVDLSVAIALDAQVAPPQQEELRNLIAAAVGQPIENIEILPLAFSDEVARQLEEWEQQMAEAERQAMLRQYITWGIIALGLVLGLVVLVIVLRRSRRKQAAEPSFERMVGTPPQEEEVVTAARQRKKEIDETDKARQVVEKNLEDAVQLVRSWINEES